MNGIPTVELHGYPPGSPDYQEDNIDGGTDVTPFVTRVSWKHTVRDPFETIDLTLEIPARLLRKVIPGMPRIIRGGRWPQTGFWVVVKVDFGKGPRAVAWGYCARIGTGSSFSGGLVRTQKVQVQCTSWVSLAQKSRLILTADMRTGRDLSGFLFRMQTWQAALSDLMSLFSFDAPGGLLERLFPRLLRFWVPPSLCAPVKAKVKREGPSTGLGAALDEMSDVLGLSGGPRRIGDEVRIVFDAATAKKWAPSRAHQTLPVTGWAINAVQNRTPHGNLWDLFTSTFDGDPNLVEFFPALEPAARETPDAYQSPLPSAMGARPILVYRLKPYQFEPLNLATIRKTDPEANRPMEAERAGLFQDAVSRDSGPDYQWSARQVTDWSVNWADSDRVNGIQVRTPFQPSNEIAKVGIIGEPLLVEEDVLKSGLRFYEAEWPFFPVDVSIENEGTYVQRIDALNEFAFATCGRSEVFATGSFTGAYRPSVQAGHWCTVDFPEPGDDRDNATPKDAEFGLLFRLHAYIEAVTHTVEVIDRKSGATRARSSVEYVRGSGSDDGEPLAPYYGRRYNTEPVGDMTNDD